MDKDKKKYLGHSKQKFKETNVSQYSMVGFFRKKENSKIL